MVRSIRERSLYFGRWRREVPDAARTPQIFVIRSTCVEWDLGRFSVILVAVRFPHMGFLVLCALGLDLVLESVSSNVYLLNAPGDEIHLSPTFFVCLFYDVCLYAWVTL